ncbi:dUTP diphosphatase [Staphylococcus aureus]|uniref:dUTPase n=1 Tax=Staphylococcus aureus TaxID=1280 RepID=UPI00091CD92D|nr:dUTPase [Staphylococcus aureus]MCD0562769.1 dUTPase [Staphylococcus aureus]MCD0573973.1 dUTPase [Staphylococcus aureus]MDI0209625.1 dUTP diphosphatase [Staphylococcus aureus]MDQ7198084.1 dUTP diphosphatase [Staphylococcus aureus]MRW38481.1 dUTPase [Staphylococcus aureus]
MTNTLTIDQLQELLQIQKEFDDRIPTLNLRDSKIAYVVEFFEWFNTLETFKNWKKKPGKPLDVQLDELADMLAFGLSIANQSGVSLKTLEKLIPSTLGKVCFNTSSIMKDFMEDFVYFGLGEEDSLSLPLNIAYNLYSIDQLIDAYKKKMKRNHERQDGTADAGKGYV